MKKTASDDQFTKAETERRFTAALGRALTTPHKLQKPLKKAKAKVKKKKPSR
jgi:hypothetical protein